MKLRISEGLSAKTMFTVAVSATWLSAIPQLQQCNATVTKCGPGNRACTHTHTHTHRVENAPALNHPTLA